MNERRRYERLAFFCPLRLAVLPGGRDIPANSFDISIAGVGLVAGLCPERGAHVRLRFLLKSDSAETVEEEILGRVAYSRADEDGNRIGIEFLKLPNESAQPTLMKKINSL